MKTNLQFFTAVILSFLAGQLRAGIIAGPITNPVNGHDYYLLTPGTWNAAEAEAESLGGTLAIINSAAEQEWVFSKFGTYGGRDRDLWIGLRRQWQGGPFAWVSGEKSDYLNWGVGQPDNAGGVENCVEISQAEHRGAWNDASESQIRNGVVEVPGNSEERVLTGKEKELIGTWYVNGDPDQPCWIAGTEKLLFAVDQNKDASQIIFTPAGSLFSPQWKQHAEIVKDRLLWSKGNWWSRSPVNYSAPKPPGIKNEPRTETPKRRS